MGDVQEEKGKLVVQEFQTEYGAEYAHFCKVDVTKTADVKGITARVTTMAKIDIDDQLIGQNQSMYRPLY